MTKVSLNRAMKRKDDEFYTRIGDIEKELSVYDLRGKSVICPCDSKDSKFYVYLKNNFRDLGITYLTATSLNGSCIEYDGERESERELSNGDFLDTEIRNLIRQSDVVITNPPFSLIRRFIPILMEDRKDFLVVAPYTCLYYLSIFQYVKDGLISFGHNHITEFDNNPTRFYNVGWITTFPVSKPPLSLTHSYTPAYKMLDDGSALCIDRLNDIPYDYDGIMAVPCTILTKINHNQFRILGVNHGPICEGRCRFKRILIKRV